MTTNQPDTTGRGSIGTMVGYIVSVMLLYAPVLAVQPIAAPILGKKYFQCTDAQSLVLTMAPLVLAVFSIFWGALLPKGSIRQYLLIYACSSMVPIGLFAFVTNIGQVIALYVVASIGVCAWPAVNGEILRGLFDQRARNHAFAWAFTATCGLTALLVWIVGRLMEFDAESFRYTMPALMVVQLLGAAAMSLLVRTRGIERPGKRDESQWRIKDVVQPVLHMNSVLKADRNFFRYEAAFMTYGIGWMICNALLPLIVTDALSLNYAEISSTTATAYMITMCAFTIPMGFITARIGPTRISALSFAVFAFHPLMLVFVAGKTSLTAASVVYGIASAGANMGWMLGPVSFAPTQDKVPQYVAIHTTLVGLRGALFQGLGFVIYKWTGSFTPALLVAAGGYAWASWQMVQLARVLSAHAAPPIAPAPTTVQSQEFARPEPVELKS